MTTELERYKEAFAFALMQAVRFAPNVTTANQIQEGVNDILNPPPEYEEVTIERWECKSCGLVTKDIKIQCPCMGDCYTHSSDDYIKLTGTLKRLKPQKVTSIVELGKEYVSDKARSEYPNARFYAEVPETSK